MSNIYNFIKDGLNNFNYYEKDTPELKDICIALNELLNDVVSNDYEAHLKNNCDDIKAYVENLFNTMAPCLYTDLRYFVDLICAYQEYDAFKQDRRDHYFHSIQCFLLGLTLYEHLDPPSNNNDILVSIFYLTIYHDIGYLYEKRKFFLGTPTSIIRDMLTSETHSLREMRQCFFVQHPYKEPEECKMLDKKISEEIKGGTINEIWEQEPNKVDVVEIERLIKNKFTGDPLSSHSVKSAIFLNKIIKSKDVLSSMPLVGFSEKPEVINILPNQKKDIFEKLIKAISCHDLNIKDGIDFKDNFWECFMMAIDELQDYGRPYQKGSAQKAINPKDVNLEWTKNKLRIKCISQNRTFNCQTVSNNLKSKLKLEALAFLENSQ